MAGEEGVQLNTDPVPYPEPGGIAEPIGEPYNRNGESPLSSYDPLNNPNPEPEVDVKPTDEPFAEPVPKWDVALEEYGKAWEFHIYFMGIAFALIGVYSLFSIVRLNRQKRLLSRGYFLALNVMIAVLAVDRAVYLLVDAYNHKSIFPLPVSYLLLGMGFPCLTSAFSILFLALLQSTKTQLVPPKIQKPTILASVIAIHFTISFTSDTLLGFFASTFYLTLICQVSFIIWGLFLSISFMLIFRRLYRSTQRVYRESVRLSLSKRSLSLTSRTVRIPRNSWGNAIKLTLLVSLLGFLTALLQLYGIIVVYSPVGGIVPEPWPWWAYQFIFRCVELAMCITMSYVATQPFRYTKDGREKDCTAFCGMCAKSKEEDLEEHEYWKKYFEAAPADTFLPKTELDRVKADLPAKTTQTSWKECSNVNDASLYDSNSMKKLLHKDNRFKGLSKTCSTQDLHSLDPSQMKVTSQSFSSFGLIFAPDTGQVIHNDLQSLQNQKNQNMSANTQSTPSSPLLMAEAPFSKGETDKLVSPIDVNAPLLNRESAV